MMSSKFITERIQSRFVGCIQAGRSGKGSGTIPIELTFFRPNQKALLTPVTPAARVNLGVLEFWLTAQRAKKPSHWLGIKSKSRYTNCSAQKTKADAGAGLDLTNTKTNAPRREPKLERTLTDLFPVTGNALRAKSSKCTEGEKR